MIDLAFKYEEELKNLFYDTWLDEKYKFFHISYFNEYKKPTSNWNECEFVSKDSSGKVIGHITYEVYRQDNSITSLAIINFSDNKTTFGLDLFRVLDDVFTKYNFRKMSFTVVIGNPIEKMYDKFILKYGGRIVGIKKAEAILNDGKLYDRKLYEIFREDYLKAKNYNEIIKGSGRSNEEKR